MLQRLSVYFTLRFTYSNHSSVSVSTAPRRNVGLQNPRFQFVVEKNVKTEQFVTAVAASDVRFDGRVYVRF